jgi:hypothetical protein
LQFLRIKRKEKKNKKRKGNKKIKELSRGEICVANFRPPCDIYDRQ